MYLGKKQKVDSTGATSTYVWYWNWTKMRDAGHRIFMDNYFLSQKPFNDVHYRKMKACDTVSHRGRQAQPNFSP